MQGESLAPVLQRCGQEAAAALGALGTEWREEKRECAIGLLMKTVKIEFVLASRFSCPPNVLFCRLYLRKNCRDFFQLSEVLGMLDTDDFQVSYYPYIESAKRLEDCFAALMDLVGRHLSTVEKASADEKWMETKQRDHRQTMMRFLAQKEEVIPTKSAEAEEYHTQLCKLYEWSWLQRFTQFKGYTFYLNGDHLRAQAQYRKLAAKGLLLPYEEQLLSYMRRTPTEKPPVPSCYGLWSAERAQRREGWLLLGGVLAAYVVCSLVFSALVTALSAFWASGTQVYCGMPWWGGLLLAGVPGLFIGLAVRRPLLYLLGGKQRKQRLAYDRLFNKTWINRFAWGIAGMALAGSLVLTVHISGINLRFYGNRLTYDSGEAFPRWQPQTVDYSQLQKVYYADGRYNMYGDWIGRPSYVLTFRDGTWLDLDGYTSPEDTQERILPLLQEYIGEPLAVHSVSDIPDWVAEELC